MHIVVCVKQVPDTTEVRIDPERGTLIREGVPSILNPPDTYAIEAAAAVRDQLGGLSRLSRAQFVPSPAEGLVPSPAEGLVPSPAEGSRGLSRLSRAKPRGLATVLSMGPPQAESVVREALARGCDRGILLTDPAFAGSDTWSTSYTLACAVRKMGDVRLVICGKQAIDGDTAQVGPGIAVHLGWPQATYVRRILEASEDTIVVQRLTDWGNETLRIELPAVLTVLKDLNFPRLPSLVSQMTARRCSMETWSAEDVGGDTEQFGLSGSPTRVVRVFTPPPRGECVRWEGEPEQTAGKLVRALEQRRLL